MKTIQKISFTLLFLVFNLVAFCQGPPGGGPPGGPPGGGGPGPGPGCDSPMPPPGCPNVPVDAHTIIVMFVGVLFALFLLHKSLKNEMAKKN